MFAIQRTDGLPNRVPPAPRDMARRGGYGVSRGEIQSLAEAPGLLNCLTVGMVLRSSLYSVVYVSTAVRPFSPEDLAVLLARSRERN